MRGNCFEIWRRGETGQGAIHHRQGLSGQGGPKGRRRIRPRAGSFGRKACCPRRVLQGTPASYRRPSPESHVCGTAPFPPFLSDLRFLCFLSVKNSVPGPAPHLREGLGILSVHSMARKADTKRAVADDACFFPKRRPTKKISGSTACRPYLRRSGEGVEQARHCGLRVRRRSVTGDRSSFRGPCRFSQSSSLACVGRHANGLRVKIPVPAPLRPSSVGVEPLYAAGNGLGQ